MSVDDEVEVWVKLRPKALASFISWGLWPQGLKSGNQKIVKGREGARSKISV